MTVWLSRSTLFGAFFAVSAFILALFGKLDQHFVHVIIAVHGYIIARAIAEDHK
jgi:hypothetical protein